MVTFIKLGLLKDEFPDAFARIVKPVDPTVDIHSLTSGSGKSVIWECFCGMNFARTVQVTIKKNRFTCKICSITGKSRLEFEVAELLSVILKTKVINHHGNAKINEVDIYIPSLDLAVQLDPYYTHKNKAEIDSRILLRMKESYSRVLRVREIGLDETSNSVFVPKGSHATIWTQAICDYLKVDTSNVSPENIDKALVIANTRWDKLFSEPLEINLHNSIYGNEFIKNLTHPGRKPEYTPRKCSDRMLWACKNEECNNTWDCSLLTRKGESICPSCADKLTGYKEAKAPIGKSISELSSQMSKMFVSNLTHPERGIDVLRVTSGDTALWICDKGHSIKKRIDAMYKHPNCQQCIKEFYQNKKLLNRSKPKVNKITLYPFFIEEFSPQNNIQFSQISHSQRTKEYVWQCKDCSLEFSSTIRNRVRMLDKRFETTTDTTCLHRRNSLNV